MQNKIFYKFITPKSRLGELKSHTDRQTDRVTQTTINQPSNPFAKKQIFLFFVDFSPLTQKEKKIKEKK